MNRLLLRLLQASLWNGVSFLLFKPPQAAASLGEPFQHLGFYLFHVCIEFCKLRRTLVYQVCGCITTLTSTKSVSTMPCHLQHGSFPCSRTHLGTVLLSMGYLCCCSHCRTQLNLILDFGNLFVSFIYLLSGFLKLAPHFIHLPF